MTATYTSVSSLLPFIFETAIDYAKEAFFMPNLVQVMSDMTGMQPRTFQRYPSSGTVWNNIGESTEITAQGFNYTNLGTITPKEVAYRIDLYDQRMMTDGILGMDAAADIAREFAYKIMRQPEVDLIAHFSSFTGGTVWAGSSVNTAGTLSWGNVYAARAVLEKNNIPGPYYVVVDNYHYHHLATAANIAGLSNAGPLAIRDEIQRQYTVQQVGNDMFLYTTPNCGTASAQVYMGVFSRPALQLDIRRGLRIETERDASKRLLELVANMYYGTGTMQPTYGVQIRGTVLTTVNN